MPTATQGTSEAQINQLNIQMRQAPWYEDWFAARGLDPNRVKLTKAQREELAALAARNGFGLGARMKIDEAGNINQQGGWAGMSPGMKAAILAAAGAATGGALAAGGAFGGAAGGAGSAAGGSGVGAGGLGSGLSAASAGAAAHVGSPLLMGGGSLIPMGASAGAAGSLPTLASRSIGSGMGTDPSIFGAGSGRGLGSAAGTAGGAMAAGRGYGGKIMDALTGEGGGLGDSAIRAALSALAGLPALMKGNGPSDEERAYNSQATRLLGQQEQRTQFQNPLYEAATRMAYGLLPNMGTNGQPYPLKGLSDVQVPGLEDLIAQRRA